MYRPKTRSQEEEKIDRKSKRDQIKDIKRERKGLQKESTSRK